MSAVMIEQRRHRSRDPDETRIQSTFLDVVLLTRGNAAEIDRLHADLRCDHKVRRMARELAEADIRPERVHLVADLLRAALDMAVGL